jgi:hypothetical protein
METADSDLLVQFVAALSSRIDALTSLQYAYNRIHQLERIRDAITILELLAKSFVEQSEKKQLTDLERNAAQERRDAHRRSKDVSRRGGQIQTLLEQKPLSDIDADADVNTLDKDIEEFVRRFHSNFRQIG